jgi:hypothetical protein
MTLGILTGQLVAANHHGPGPAAHLALLGAIVVIGLVVFAVVRWRRRHEEKPIDELTMHESSTDDAKTDTQTRQRAE